MRQPLVAGNWKMHGSRAMARALSQAVVRGTAELDAIEVVLLPPYVLIPRVSEEVADSAVVLGAQNVATAREGAFTGEISAPMLREFGCRYALVGHSERRQLFGETDALVAKRALAALQEDLRPIVCVGETLAEREASETEDVVLRQLDAVLSAVPEAQLGQVVFAYEPVWAIGTGRTATPEQAQAVHALLRERLRRLSAEIGRRARILYGGSMKPGNAGELLAMPDIDGGLIGGASLVADDFLAICEQAALRRE